MNNQSTNPPPPSSVLTLSIWRNFAPSRALALQDGEHRETRFVTSDSDLQEEVYAWRLPEDIFSGIENYRIRRDLRQKLFDRMDPALPPSERPLALLDEFIEAALEAVQSGDVEPASVQHPPTGDDDASVGMNILLALALHLKWLSRCFADRRGISVSVR